MNTTPTRQANAAKRIRRSLAITTLAVAAAVPAGLPQHAGATTVTRPAVLRTPVRSGTPVTVPTAIRRALVVLLENRGTTFGLPDDVTVPVATCASFRSPAGADPVTFIASIAGSIGSAVQCLDPRNWSIVQVPIAEYVRQQTDFNAQQIGTTLINTSGASNKYERVVILQDAAVSASRLRQELTALTPAFEIDIHVLAHGDRTSIAGSGNTFILDTDIRNLSTIAGLKLRAVYQQNCNGSGLNDDWRGAGAKVVTGSAGLNMTPLTYASFLRRWVAGETFSSAVTGSSAEWNPYFSTMYKMVDEFNGETRRNTPIVSYSFALSPDDELTSSRMIVDGDGAIRVN